MRYKSRCAMAFLTMLIASASFAVEVADVRVSQLEQEILFLKQQLTQQARRIESLESAASRSGSLGASLIEGSPRRSAEKNTESNTEGTRLWLKSANWDKLKIGMEEGDVLKILGVPTTSRESGTDSKTWFYALELDAGGFLSGRVIVANRRISEIHKPALR